MLAYRQMLADWTGKAGDPAAAAAQFQDLAERSARRRGNDDQYTTALLQRLAYWQAQAGTTKDLHGIPSSRFPNGPLI